MRDLKKDLSEALPSHNQHVDKVNGWISALRGELKIKVQDGRSKVQPKLIRKQNEWRYSALEEPFLSTDDMFVVNPVTHLDVDAARQNMLVLNKQFRVDIPKVHFINKYVRTAVNTGTVIVKLNWEVERDTVLEEIPVYTQTAEELYTVLQQKVMNGEMPEEEAMALMESGQPIQIGVESREVEKEVINRPVLQVRDSRNIIIDPSCEGDIDNAQFIIDKFLTDMSTLKKDSRYSNLDKINEKEYSTSITDYSYYDSEFRNDPNFSFNDNKLCLFCWIKGIFGEYVLDMEKNSLYAFLIKDYNILLEELIKKIESVSSGNIYEYLEDMFAVDGRKMRKMSLKFKDENDKIMIARKDNSNILSRTEMFETVLKYIEEHYGFVMGDKDYLHLLKLIKENWYCTITNDEYCIEIFETKSVEGLSHKCTNELDEEIFEYKPQRILAVMDNITGKCFTLCSMCMSRSLDMGDKELKRFGV